MNATIAALVAKDLHQNRGPIVCTVVTGVISLGLCLVHPIGIAVGGLAYLSGLIALGCMLAMGIWKERENGSLLFSLSLPLSGRDYLAAKTIGVILSYLTAWVPLVIAAAVTIYISAVLPHGLVLFITLLCVFLMLEFCLLTAVALLARSEGAIIGAMIVTNTVVSLYWWGLSAVPSVARSMRSPVAAWDGFALGILAVQVALAIVLLVIPIRLGARKSLL